jgi:hypothetical protein
MHYDGIILTDAISGHRIRPLGAYALANELRKNGYNILVIDFYFQMGIKNISELLINSISEKTLFVGYSSSLFVGYSNISFMRTSGFLPNNDYQHFLNINKLIKKINPTTQILFGGSNSKSLTAFNLKYRNNLLVDYVIHGYSETMIVDFVKNIEKGLPQIVRNTYNGLKEIDYDFKAENFDFHNSIHSWNNEDAILKNEVLPLEVARGCIFKCKYCSYPLLGKNPKDNSYIKREDMLLREILENYEKYNTTNYFLIDDTFNERTDKIQLLLNVRDRSKLDLNFAAFNRIELIARKPEQLPLLRDLNINGMFFGIESLNYESAKAIGKGIKKEEIQETLLNIKNVFNNKVSITTGIIVGLPHETEETFHKNFEWLKSEDSGVDTLSIMPLELAISTHTDSSFVSNPGKYGYTIIDIHGNWISDNWTYKRASEVASNCMTEVYNSGRQRMAAFTSLHLTSLGYDFQRTIKMSKKDLDEKLVRTQQRTFMNNYIQEIKKIVE